MTDTPAKTFRPGGAEIPGISAGSAGRTPDSLENYVTHGADFVLILNNDTILEEDALLVLVDHARAHPDAGILGPKLVTPDGGLDRNCARRRPIFGDYLWRVGPGAFLWRENRWKRRHYFEGEYMA